MKDQQEASMNALSGAESIEEYYQLSHDPFAARTPGFKFFTPQRKTVLAQLHHLARFGDQVLIVTGPEGSGKTLLRQVLVASSNKDTTQCVVTTAREFPEASALISFLCQAVNATGRDSEALLLRAGQLHETGVNLYLIIDDAHLLEPEALQELVDLSGVSESEAALRIFLFADESVQPMLDSVSAEEEGAEWLHLIPLQPYLVDETRDYLAQRLEGAGQGLELLEEDQVQWIHRHSGGWPGRINDAARQSMREAMEEQASPAVTRRNALPLKSIIAVVLVAVGIGFAWFMGDRQEEPSMTVLELPEPVVPVDANNDPELAELTEFNANAGAASSGLDMGSDGAALGAPEQSVPADPAPAEVVVPAKTVVAERAVEPEPSPTTAVADAPEQSSVTTSPEQAPRSDPGRETATGPESARPTTTASGADWYRAQESGRYVLQVLGSRSQQAARDFIAENAGVQDLQYFQTTHQGAPWFVVTQGNYPGRQQAQQGISSLPGAMRSSSPWPRSIGDIQQALD